MGTDAIPTDSAMLGIEARATVSAPESGGWGGADSVNTRTSGHRIRGAVMWSRSAD